jgi:hypothetical protein
VVRLVRKRKVLVLNGQFRPKRPKNGLYPGHTARTSVGNSTSGAFRNPGSLPRPCAHLFTKTLFIPICLICMGPHLGRSTHESDRAGGARARGDRATRPPRTDRSGRVRVRARTTDAGPAGPGLQLSDGPHALPAARSSLAAESSCAAERILATTARLELMESLCLRSHGARHQERGRCVCGHGHEECWMYVVRLRGSCRYFFTVPVALALVLFAV